MPITTFLRKKAEETIDIMLNKNLPEMEINEAKGFFVTINKNPLNGVVLKKITKKEINYYICQKV